MLLPYSIFPLGDSALIVDFGNVIDESINRRVLQLFQRLQSLSLPYVKDAVPAYASLTVHYDVAIVLQQHPKTETAFEAVSGAIRKILEDENEEAAAQNRTVRIPVCYAEKFAPDLNEIAAQKKLPANEIIRLHTSKSYRVYMIGFLPGFPYMGEVDERIATPRKQQPRQNVEAGSVGIAGRQTGIYPLRSPGGWQIIGRTPLALFNSKKEEPVLLRPGDEVQFYSITDDEFENYQNRLT